MQPPPPLPLASAFLPSRPPPASPSVRPPPRPDNLYPVRLLTKSQRIKRSYPPKLTCDICGGKFNTKRDRAVHYSNTHAV